MNQVDDLLEQIKLQNLMAIRLLARLNFSSQEVESILSRKRRGSANKIVRAYNMCDGKTPVSQIAKRAGVDQGNFSRDLQHWEEAGILMRIPASKASNEIFPFALLPIHITNGKVHDDE